MSEHQHHNQSTSNIKIAFFLNLIFTIIEIVGGIFTNSLAILSDALHDLGDSLSLGLAWYFQHLSKKGRDHKYSYGYKRFSLLGALINSVILLLGSVYIISESIPRIIEPEITKPEGMFLLAILGILVNGAAALRLKKGKTQNERVVALHLLEDVLGWTGVLIGSIIIYFTGWHEIDPILSLGIALYILINIYRNLKQSLNIILQAIPDGISMKKVQDILEQIKNVKSIHDLHIWSLDGERNVLTVHLVVDTDLDDAEARILKEETRAKMHQLGISHSTIEIEREDEDCDWDPTT
jgi:cobalt-zinc-cadmium efflux system protein